MFAAAVCVRKMSQPQHVARCAPARESLGCPPSLDERRDALTVVDFMLLTETLFSNCCNSLLSVRLVLAWCEHVLQCPFQPVSRSWTELWKIQAQESLQHNTHTHKHTHGNALSKTPPPPAPNKTLHMKAYTKMLLCRRHLHKQLPSTAPFRIT